MSNELPRRNRRDLWTPAETAIQDAVDVVETAGASPLLTSAVMLMAQARALVADHVEGQASSDAIYSNPSALRCPRCQGPLRDSGPNVGDTVRFVDCAGECGYCWTVGFYKPPASSAPPAAPQDAPGRLEPHDWISQHAPGVDALRVEPKPGWAIYCNNPKCPVKPVGKEVHQSLQEAVRYANRPTGFAQTLENVEWLGKILLQQEVGGTDDDIDKVWRLIAMRPSSMRSWMAKARRLLAKIRRRSEQ